jgi:hypothetical protein
MKILHLCLLGAWLSGVALTAHPLHGGDIYPLRDDDGTVRFNLSITVVQGSPACGPERPVILINGLFQPTLHARSNDTIEVAATMKGYRSA